MGNARGTSDVLGNHARVDDGVVDGQVRDLRVVADRADPSRELLERLAVALNALRELPAVAILLAEATKDAIGADRCTLFLIEGRQLRPVVSRSAVRDEQSQVLATLGSRQIEPEHWDRFCSGRALFIPAATDSDIIPSSWVKSFSLVSLVLVPLVAGDEPVGLVALDWSTPRSADPEQLALLETIGSMAAVAVRNVRLIQRLKRRAELQQALADAAATLAAPTEPEAIAERLADAFTELLHARQCAIALVDDAQSAMTAVATRHCRDLHVLPIESIPEDLVTAIGETWADDKRPLEFAGHPWLAETLHSHDVDATWYLVLPLVMHGHTRGAALLGFAAETDLEDEERDAAGALAAIAAAALERHELVDRLGRNISQLDTLYRLTRQASQAPNASSLLTALNESLASQGIEVTGLAFRQPRLARYFGGDEPTVEERKAWRDGAGYAHLPDGQLAVPMLRDKRLVGSVRVRPDDLDSDRREFLEVLAQGLAEVAARGALRAKVEESSRERALEVERSRIAADVHDATGQLFVALGLLARRHAQRFEPESEAAAESLRMAELAERGKARTNEAVREGMFLPAGHRGLVPALRGLAESFESDSGIAVLTEVTGASERLSSKVERTLYRVAHEALTNAWRHAECSVVWVDLDLDGGDHVALSVRDNGAGLRSSETDHSSHFGVAGMQEAIVELGGMFEIGDADDRGVRILAQVPRSSP